MTKFSYVAMGALFGFVLLVEPRVSDANLFFSHQTGQQCVACHQPGQELQGAGGLNATGQAFKDCGETPACFPPPMPSQSFVRTTAAQGGTATFSHRGCHHQSRYITIQMGGTMPIGIVLDRDMEVHIAVAQNSTFASACGGYPGPGANYRYITLD